MTQNEIELLRLEDVTGLEVKTSLADLIGQAVVVYNKTTGLPMAFDADIMSGRQRIVVGRAAEIDAITDKKVGVLYCTIEDEEL